MDNLTHTLVGLALAESGLKRRTALGTATLAIGANFPDIDVVAVPLGVGLEWRRGVTHGFLALAILPFVLAGLVWSYDRYVRQRRSQPREPVDYRQLVVLSAIAIITHPTLDFMNTYGMRWLMPFVDKWFYADGLFIVDLWVLATLLVGVIWSRRARDIRPAAFALTAVGLYTTGMLAITQMGRLAATREFPYRRVMIAPNGVVPWRRDVLVEDTDRYRTGAWQPGSGITMSQLAWPKGEYQTGFEAARGNDRVRKFLGWARFPMVDVTRTGRSTEVWIGDARYEGAEWASVRVTLP